MSKIRVFGLMLLCMAGMLAVSAVAQENTGSPADSPNEHWRGHHPMDPAKRTEMMTKRLGLTTEQQPKVLEVLKSEQEQMEKLHSDSSLSQEDRHGKMIEIHKATNDQVRALLDADQQKKFDEMQSRREQWQGHHRDGEKPASPDQQQ